MNRGACKDFKNISLMYDNWEEEPDDDFFLGDDCPRISLVKQNALRIPLSQLPHWFERQPVDFTQSTE